MNTLKAIKQVLITQYTNQSRGNSLEQNEKAIETQPEMKNEGEKGVLTFDSSSSKKHNSPYK